MDDTDRIAEIRRFNRAFARWLRLFNEHYSKTEFSPAESRLFYELSAAGHASAVDLARAMGVDPAYMSRMVQKLASLGLVAVTPGTADRRRTQLALTREGDQVFARQNGAADDSIAKLIEPLSETERGELVSAMRTI